MGKKLAADDWLELRSRNILQSDKLEDDGVAEKSDDGKALPVPHEMKGQEQDGNKTEEDWLELRSRNILQSAGEEEGFENLDERSKEAVSTEKRKSKRGKTAETITESKTIFASETENQLDYADQSGEEAVSTEKRKSKRGKAAETITENKTVYASDINKPVADSKLSQNLEEDHEKQTEEDWSEKTSTGAITEVSLSKENPELLEEDWLELRSRSVLQSSNVTDYEEEKQGEVLLPQFVTEEDDSSETLKTGNVYIEHQADERSGEALQIGKRRSKRGKGYSEIAESMSAETSLGENTESPSSKESPELISIDFASGESNETLQEDWLELRSRDILQLPNILIEKETPNEELSSQSSAHLSHKDYAGDTEHDSLELRSSNVLLSVDVEQCLPSEPSKNGDSQTKIVIVDA